MSSGSLEREGSAERQLDNIGSFLMQEVNNYTAINQPPQLAQPSGQNLTFGQDNPTNVSQALPPLPAQAETVQPRKQDYFSELRAKYARDLDMKRSN